MTEPLPTLQPPPMVDPIDRLRITPFAGLTASASRRTRRTVRSREILLALGPAVVALSLGLLAFDGVQRARESRALVGRTRDVLIRTMATFSTLQDAETGQRGYLLTSDPAYLGPYDRATAALPRDTLALRALLHDSPLQQRRLDTLEILARRKMDELATSITIHRESGPAQSMAVVRSNAGKETMDAIRRVIGTMTTSERALLDERLANEEARGRVVSIILVAGTIAAGLFSLALTGRLLFFANAQARLAAELEDQNLQLEQQGLELEMQSQQLQDQATELELQNEELRTATEELMQSGAELEATNEALAERTSAAEAARVLADSANQAKSNFLAMMSHELRTPLNAIAGYTQLMQLGVPEPVSDAHLDYLDRIQQSQYHLLGVINSVLNFARVEAGTLAYDIQDVVVETLLAGVEPLVITQARARRHVYSCEPCDRALVVRADAEKTMQILINLVSNSIKFTAPGGVIAMSAEAVDGMAHLRVRDTGPGIPPDKQGVIFDPFLQLDTSRTRTTEGTGLGLSISRELARGMGGDLTVQSTVGVGSIFTLALPRAV